MLKACDFCGLGVFHWALLKGSSIVLIAYISVLCSLASRVSDFFSNIGTRSSFAFMLDRVPITVTTPGFFCGEEEPRSRYSTKAVIPAIKTTEAETVPTILINLVPRWARGLPNRSMRFLFARKSLSLIGFSYIFFHGLALRLRMATRRRFFVVLQAT